jgi:hypothetical protein
MTMLPEIAQRILSELEDFREDNIFAMMNTVFEPDGTLDEVSTFADALTEIINADYATLVLERFYPRERKIQTKLNSLILVSKLRDWAVFDAPSRRWTLKDGDINRDAVPVVCLTGSGYSMATQLLHALGYQWWKSGRQ